MFSETKYYNVFATLPENRLCENYNLTTPVKVGVLFTSIAAAPFVHLTRSWFMAIALMLFSVVMHSSIAFRTRCVINREFALQSIILSYNNNNNNNSM